MNSSAPIPILTADAGSPEVLMNPTSPEALVKKATEQRVQAGADTQYDATLAEGSVKKEGFQLMEEDIVRSPVPPAIFLAMGILIVLYSVAAE